MSKRALRAALLCALLLQAIFPQGARPAIAAPAAITCAISALGSETPDSRDERSHDLCCTQACAGCCTALVALLAAAIFLPPRRPAAVGLVEDQFEASGAPLGFGFAARGPPHS